MDLFIIRHGEAVDGYPDSHRKLSGLGKSQVASAGVAHSNIMAEIEVVFSSPYLRATQTADLFLGQLSEKNSLEINRFDDLMPLGDIMSVVSLLQKHHSRVVLLVAHMPILGGLIDYLTGEQGTHLGTASLASLSMDFPARDMATLNWIHDAD
ncbi:MAG: phosphohistidine phosphatase SixA [SAR92 clade bacterium]|uniref:Phosphohistidine phosphatase SixA n=1 Tax=SAR92 clade bacterium TaxID=2315479 RepID=A0A520MG84_9GAMM|nr:MAG: phosphohistidine phosphatase SixA [SAR92 clade bacterium]